MATQLGVGWRGSPRAEMRTRDLLGGSLRNEIDLDLDVQPQPISGWEKRLDMKSGKVYFHKCNAQENPTDVALHDLNFPPCPAGDSGGVKEGSPKFCELEWLCRVTGDRMEDGAVRPLEELNFMGKGGSRQDDPNPMGSVELGVGEEALGLRLSNDEWQSVCTLDKVKMALKRAERESGKRKREGSPSVSSSSCEGEREGEGEGLQAAGCPRCLVYVLLPKSNPRCPRCGSSILLNTPTPFKRPHSAPLDLNSLI